MPRILVTGGTGTLGHALLPQLAGHLTIRLLSRKERPDDTDPSLEWYTADLTKAEHLGPALEDVDIVLHAATQPSQPRKVDLEGTRNLLEEARKAGIKHFVYPSIVGIDHIPLSYYRGKLEAERAVASSGLPYSIQRFTQFHNLVDAGLNAFNRLPGIMLLPKTFLFQPLDPKDAARYLAETIYAAPAGYRTDVVGPEILSLEILAQAWQEARAERKKLINLPIPGRTARRFRAGHNTQKHLDPPFITGQTPWREWLELQYARYRRRKAQAAGS